MSELPPVESKQTLLENFGKAFGELEALVAATPEQALLTKTDAAGWNSRDHLAHLGAWVNSVIVMIRDGHDQWTGLGAPQELFSHTEYDPLNEAIRQRTIDLSVDDVMAEFRERNATMLGLLDGMSDDDLHRPVSTFVAGEAEFPIYYKIDGNGPYHYREHLGYIPALLG